MTLGSYIPAWGSRQISTVPNGYRPAIDIAVPLVSDRNVAVLKIKPTGEVYVAARSNKVSNADSDNLPTNITISAVYPVS